MYLFIFQIGLALMLFMFSFIFARYEGSRILYDSREWKYSTPFSHFLNGNVHHSSNISQLDYFIYAAKFYPIFPAMMIISGLYLIILIGFHFLKNKSKWFASYLSFLGAGLLFFSYFVFNSPTVRKTFFSLFLLMGLLCMLMAVMSYFQILNRSKEIKN